MKTIADILKDSNYSFALFERALIDELESKIIEKDGKPYVACVIRDKEIVLKPEEVVRQLYLMKLIKEYGYPKKRIALEHPIHFGREVKSADIIIFATPIWWGGRSSLMQRVIERMDAFDEAVIAGGRAVLLNKVAGIVITGSEDGAQATLAGMMEVLSFLNFTLPPQCCTYWVGEVGMDPKTDAERRRKNPAVEHMAKNTAKNLVAVAKLLKANPLV